MPIRKDCTNQAKILRLVLHMMRTSHVKLRTARFAEKAAKQGAAVGDGSANQQWPGADCKSKYKYRAKTKRIYGRCKKGRAINQKQVYMHTRREEYMAHKRAAQKQKAGADHNAENAAFNRGDWY